MNNEKGTIYLIQPAELIGTDHYKIGCSAKNDFARCKKGYKKGTRYMDIRECDDPFAVEREVKIRFNFKFNLVAGKEYFKGNEADIKKEFNDVISKFTSLKEEEEECSGDIYFKFKSQGLSVNPWLLKSKALFNPPCIDVTAKYFDDYEIDCRDNFNKEEQTLIKKYNIQSLDDLLRCENIASYDKERALQCYKYVRDRTLEKMGTEPCNGNANIQMGKYMFNIKISFDKTLKFIGSVGIKTHDDLHIIKHFKCPKV
jgi:hypothetical protein